MTETPKRRRSSAIPAAASSAAGSEANLLDLLRAGDEVACETVVRDHMTRLLAVARRYMRNADDARDAVQEAFIAAFRAIGRFEGGSSLRPGSTESPSTPAS